MNRFNLSDLLLVAAVVLLGLAGVWLFTQSGSPKNELQVGFVDLDSLKKLQSLTTNRLALKIHNPSRTVAKIVGNNAC